MRRITNKPSKELTPIAYKAWAVIQELENKGKLETGDLNALDECVIMCEVKEFNDLVN